MELLSRVAGDFPQTLIPPNRRRRQDPTVQVGDGGHRHDFEIIFLHGPKSRYGGTYWNMKECGKVLQGVNRSL